MFQVRLSFLYLREVSTFLFLEFEEVLRLLLLLWITRLLLEVDYCWRLVIGLPISLPFIFGQIHGDMVSEDDCFDGGAYGFVDLDLVLIIRTSGYC
ncbi:hypothetical protein Tco_1081517 [Tanacetum coccineum]|uniref:Uncharacterized protein n=1 Tax=Tanacetum coccineum TaxID=301880 RepID=A0ABQ5HXT1_9ASTR